MAKIKIKLSQLQLSAIAGIYVKKMDLDIKGAYVDRNVRAIKALLKNATMDEYTEVKVKDNLASIQEAAEHDTKTMNSMDAVVCVNGKDLFGGTDPIVALLLASGDFEKYGIDGDTIPADVRDKYVEAMDYISDNLPHIEEIIHQFCTKGGIKADTEYWCLDHEHIWHEGS